MPFSSSVAKNSSCGLSKATLGPNSCWYGCQPGKENTSRGRGGGMLHGLQSANQAAIASNSPTCTLAWAADNAALHIEVDERGVQQPVCELLDGSGEDLGGGTPAKLFLSAEAFVIHWTTKNSEDRATVPYGSPQGLRSEQVGTGMAQVSTLGVKSHFSAQFSDSNSTPEVCPPSLNRELRTKNRKPRTHPPKKRSGCLSKCPAGLGRPPLRGSRGQCCGPRR